MEPPMSLPSSSGISWTDLGSLFVILGALLAGCGLAMLALAWRATAARPLAGCWARRPS